MWWIPLTLIAYALLFVFAFPTWWFYAWFVLGLLIGFNLLLVDRLIYAFWLYPEKPESVQWLEWWRTKNYRALLTNVVQGAPTESGLLTRSPLFLAVFVALTIFVVTSTGSSLGVGLMLGMGARTFLDMWQYSKDPAQFQHHFLWQVRRVVKLEEMQGITTAFGVFLVIISLLVILSP